MCVCVCAGVVIDYTVRHGTGLKTQLRSSNANVLPMDPRPSGIARRAHFACRAEVGVLGKLGRGTLDALTTCATVRVRNVLQVLEK